jgi:hypothetical protein
MLFCTLNTLVFESAIVEVRTSPNSILGLIKYAYNIKAMSTQFGFHMTRSYDETFRRVDKVMGFDWAVVNNELWRTYQPVILICNCCCYWSLDWCLHVRRKQYATVHYLQLPSQTPSLCLPYEKFYHKTLSYENQIASIADSNTSVFSVQKSMSESHVKSGLHTTSLPTPIKVNKLDNFLQGYD